MLTVKMAQVEQRRIPSDAGGMAGSSAGRVKIVFNHDGSVIPWQ